MTNLKQLHHYKHPPVETQHCTTTNPAVPHIIIIGGTSGIGLALAKHYLAEGCLVSIVGSNGEKIAQLTANLLPTYPNHCKLYQCDISQSVELQALFAQLENGLQNPPKNQPFNQLIYSAGWYFNERKQSLNQADSEKMLAINLQAFNQVFYWASEQLKKSRQLDEDLVNKTELDNGLENNLKNSLENNLEKRLTKRLEKKLVCLASVAGMLDYPDSSLYAKCKGAMIATSQAYRAGLEPFGIAVTCIVSGYVDTEQLRKLSDGDASSKPFIISETEAVTEICHAIDNDLAVHCFPKQMKRLIGLLGLFPKSLLNKIMTWQYRRQDAVK